MCVECIHVRRIESFFILAGWRWAQDTWALPGMSLPLWSCSNLARNPNLSPTEPPNITHSLVGALVLHVVKLEARWNIGNVICLSTSGTKIKGKSQTQRCHMCHSWKGDLLLQPFWAEKSGTRLQQVKAAGGKCMASMECHPKLKQGNEEGENIYIKSQSLQTSFCM